MIADFKDLDVWKKAMALTIETYRVTEKLPNAERYGLSDQMRRAAVSIPSNIAEGHSRNSNREFLRFLSIAQGSKAELETQVLLTQQLGMLSLAQTERLCSLYQEVGSMLHTIMQMIESGTWK